jgi:hypothetical protein
MQSVTCVLFGTNDCRDMWCGVRGATVTRYDDGRVERRLREMVFGMESHAEVPNPRLASVGSC